MALRITYHDGEVEPSVTGVDRVAEPVPQYGAGPAFADWDDREAPALLLFLADEPEIGHRFSYGGASWEIIDYHDGWIAQLVV